MRTTAIVLLLVAAATAQQYDDQSEEQSVQSIEQRLVSTRKALLAKLDGCTIWRDNLEDDKRETLERLLVKGQFEKFRDFAMRIARQSFPEDEDCLRSVQFLIKKYVRTLSLKKKYLGSDEASHIEEFISRRQLHELHALYKQTGRREDIEMALTRFFAGMTDERKKQLIKEFFEYKVDLRRRPRRTTHEEPEGSKVVGVPAELKDEWLKWMTDRHRTIISRLKASGADKWEVLNMRGTQFYNLRKDIRKKYDRHLQSYCTSNIKALIGERNMGVLEGMYLDNDPVDQIDTRYHEMVGDLTEEKDRMQADHYGSFCRKIFRLVPFEPADLTVWLNAKQKSLLGEMIRDPKIGDDMVYDKVYEFFMATSGEQREEARDTIDTGCRHFIAHMFGDDTAEDLEDLRLQGNISSQVLAARLAFSAKEITSPTLRKRAEQSLPMCKRIYLGYDGSCECHGHAESCDDDSHSCRNCTDNTFGVQCEKCLDGFVGAASSPDGCSSAEDGPEEEESAPCRCHRHSDTCDAEGKCQNCQHSTDGDNCEKCAPGFYGDAVSGQLEDCSACPCPNQSSCFINDEGLVQCVSCPAGTTGMTCEKKIEHGKRGGGRQSDGSSEEVDQKKNKKTMDDESDRFFWF